MAHRKRRNKKEDPSERPDPLIGPGGKVDAAALHRAAQIAERAPSPSPAHSPSSAVDDDGETELGDDDLLVAQPSTQQRVVFTLQRDLDKRLDKYLVDRITFMSRAKLQALIDAGGVRVNGRVAKASTNLRLNDTVEVLIDAPPSEDVPPEDIPLDVLYEDEHLIVINKSPDIIVHPARSNLKGTMINALAYHFRHRSRFGGHLSAVGSEFARPGVVHRLDRQTSGVIVFAKSEEAHWKLGSQFEHRQTDKRYIALVHGRVEPVIDSIDVPLGPSPSREKGHREKQVVRHDHLGKPALTVYRVLGRYCLTDPTDKASKMVKAGAGKRAPAASWSGKRDIDEEAGPPIAATNVKTDRDLPGPLVSADSPWVSLVEVELKTGRTHQIRVHMQHRLHPLLADDMYDGRAVEMGKDGPSLARVALHAAMLTFRHPMTSEKMIFTAPFPADLKGALTWLRARPLRDEPTPPGAVLSVDRLLASAKSAR